MTESQRRFKRKDVAMAITYTMDDYPLVATTAQALPMSPQGFVTKTLCGASVKNSCVDGFCFYTNTRLSPGTEVDVKMVNFTPLSLGDQRLTRCRAKVIWCHKNTNAPKNDCYEVGVQKIPEEKLPIMDMKKKGFASMKCV